MANMEELHKAASAYYSNASNELRQRATVFFNSMDTNGDGEISFNEFVQFFDQNGYKGINCNFFRSLDRNGDGFLDFSEVLTFYYILKTRCVACDYCESRLMGLYFTCVACFEHAGGNTYDLCSTCYVARRHQQQHSHHNYFLDSYVLLRATAGLPVLAGAPNLHRASVQHAPNIPQRAVVAPSAPNTPQQERSAAKAAFQALEMSLKVADFASNVGDYRDSASNVGDVAANVGDFTANVGDVGDFAANVGDFAANVGDFVGLLGCSFM